MSSRESKWELMALNVTRSSSSHAALPQHPQTWYLESTQPPIPARGKSSSGEGMSSAPHLGVPKQRDCDPALPAGASHGTAVVPPAPSASSYSVLGLFQKLLKRSLSPTGPKAMSQVEGKWPFSRHRAACGGVPWGEGCARPILGVIRGPNSSVGRTAGG